MVPRSGPSMIASQLVAEIEAAFNAIKATAHDVQSEPRLMVSLANMRSTIIAGLARAKKQEDMALALVQLKLQIPNMEKLWPMLEDKNLHHQAGALRDASRKIKNLIAGVESGRYA